MALPNLAPLRRLLAVRGLTPATLSAEASGGRIEEACLRPARLVEGDALAVHPLGPSERWAEPVAFLDGIQRSELLAYAGAAPIVCAEIAAGVRERIGGRLATVVVERRFLVLARPSALSAAGDALEGLGTLALPEDEPPHPVLDLANVSRALDRARGALELAVAARYRARSGAWLIVDGALSESPAWAEDPRIIGVAKSHATLPFGGAELELYLRLPPGHRSSVFAPATRSVAPVHAWALRLWPWEGRDLFHGLVRIEVAPVNGSPEMADLLSRRLLAERAPVSTPDRRWDRLLYGIHTVEQSLRAGAAAS
ncbi:MAG: hypothetical protein H0T68_03110 [Gemmatimonadales bacterium]|nr:hypothetical protein [Gemmatimonadales bacterium]